MRLVTLTAVQTARLHTANAQFVHIQLVKLVWATTEGPQPCGSPVHSSGKLMLQVNPALHVSWDGYLAPLTLILHHDLHSKADAR